MGFERRVSVNGEDTTLTGHAGTAQLLYALRAAGQTGPKFGCGVGQCGACTVLIDGAIVRSCLRQLSTVPEDAGVTTMDGLGDEDAPHPLQAEMMALDAGQCAFCVNGVIVGAIGWLDDRRAAGNTSPPTEEEITAFLSGRLPEYGNQNYICRCGAHPRYVEAIRRAAAEVLS